jgi:3-hydroxyisobutyrate dehydrogenase-like beta-hydroxyacid dehydrogenase
MSKTPLTIGVIGFGVMGSNMARNLAKKGHTVLGFSRTPSKVMALEPDGISNVSLAEMAERSTHIILSVTDGAAVEATLFGDTAQGSLGLTSLLHPGSLLIAYHHVRGIG